MSDRSKTKTNKNIFSLLSLFKTAVFFIFIAGGIYNFSDLYSAGVTLDQVSARSEYFIEMHKPVLRKTASAVPDIPDVSVKEVRALYSVSGDTLAYVVSFSPAGFAVMPSDDGMEPVIAYSFSSNFNFSEDENNILLYMIKNDLRLRHKAVSEIPDELKDYIYKNRKSWIETADSPGYRTAQASYTQWPSGDDTGWINKTWDQSAYYNDLCPKDPSTGKRSIVGCVATAMAQVVVYHGYPLSISLDSSDSYITSTKGIAIDTASVTLDFPDFTALSAKLSSIDYSGPAESYSPAICFAMGIFMKMDYTSSSSGTDFYCATGTYLNKLGYSDAVLMWSGSADLMGILKEDMKAGRPALLGIHQTGNIGGHAIVADGYRSTGEYHLNFGWGDTSPDAIHSCWYSLPDSMPEDYTILDLAVMRITPSNTASIASTGPVSYPNPFTVNGVNRVSISLSSSSSDNIDKAYIYDLAGCLVRELTGGRIVSWDGKNSSGNLCAPGMYFYSLHTGSGKNKNGKLTVIR